jgi:hypothetical protein
MAEFETPQILAAFVGPPTSATARATAFSLSFLPRPFMPPLPMVGPDFIEPSATLHIIQKRSKFSLARAFGYQIFLTKRLETSIVFIV